MRAAPQTRSNRSPPSARLPPAAESLVPAMRKFCTKIALRLYLRISIRKGDRDAHKKCPLPARSAGVVLQHERRRRRCPSSDSVAATGEFARHLGALHRRNDLSDCLERRPARSAADRRGERSRRRHGGHRAGAPDPDGDAGPGRKSGPTVGPSDGTSDWRQESRSAAHRQLRRHAASAQTAQAGPPTPTATSVPTITSRRSTRRSASTTRPPALPSRR